MITERRVPELIPILGSQPAGDMSHKPGSRLPLLSTRPAVTPTTLKGLLPVLLLGEQRHNGCEQFESRNITPRQVEELARDGGGALFVSRAAEAQGLYTT